MKYRTYPGTDIRASEVGFGLWTLAAGWWGEFTDEEAVAHAAPRLRPGHHPVRLAATPTATAARTSCCAGRSATGATA